MFLYVTLPVVYNVYFVELLFILATFELFVNYILL